MSDVIAKGKDKEDKVDKIKAADVKKDEKLMKKIDKFESKDQTKWVKAYVKAYNTAVADGDTEKKAAKAAEKAAFAEVPKDSGKGKKDKKASGSIKSAYIADRELLAEAGEEVPAESVDDFMMWCEASGITFTAEENMEIEFTDEEKAILGKATKAIIEEKDGSFIVTIETDNEEDGMVEISVAEGDDLEEEMEDMSEEIIDEGVEEVPEEGE